MENLEQNQSQKEVNEPNPSTVSQSVFQPPVSENKPSLVLPITLSLMMLLLGGGLVFVYFTFLKPGKMVPQATVFPSPSPVSSPSPDSTADWKVYEDKDFNFTLRYPSDWAHHRSGDSPYAAIIFLRPALPTPVNPEYGLVNIQIGKTFKEDLTYEELISTICDTPDRCASLSDTIDTMVGGLTAKKLIDYPGVIPSDKVVLIKKPNTFIFSLYLDRSYEEEYSWEEKREVFDKILSIFKFTE